MQKHAFFKAQQPSTEVIHIAFVNYKVLPVSNNKGTQVIVPNTAAFMLIRPATAPITLCIIGWLCFYSVMLLDVTDRDMRFKFHFLTILALNKYVYKTSS